MRGASYAYASRQVVALFGTQGCIAAGADFYAESVVAFSSIGIGAVTAAAFAVGLGDDSSELEAGISDTASVIAVLAGAGGYCVAATAFAIVEAAGKLLVLFLEDPNALKRTHESDFDRLSGVWHLLGKEVATVPGEREPLPGAQRRDGSFLFS